MTRYFPHESLDVYGFALEFAAQADELLCAWPSSWAVHDQFDRATESIVTNLAKAARLRATAAGIYSIECSLGSVLECASCLDVAFRRHLLDASQVRAGKRALQQIARMEIGLRGSWDGCVKEQPDEYGADSTQYFMHESLDAYRRSLEVHELLDPIWQGNRVRNRHVRRADELSTSLTVNIAEGNGRFSKVDHSKFLGIAEDAGTKLAAYLDLLAPKASIDVEQVKACLRGVMAMLSGLRGYLEE